MWFKWIELKLAKFKMILIYWLWIVCFWAECQLSHGLHDQITVYCLSKFDSYRIWLPIRNAFDQPIKNFSRPIKFIFYCWRCKPDENHALGFANVWNFQGHYVIISWCIIGFGYFQTTNVMIKAQNNNARKNHVNVTKKFQLCAKYTVHSGDMKSWRTNRHHMKFHLFIE